MLKIEIFETIRTLGWCAAIAASVSFMSQCSARHVEARESVNQSLTIEDCNNSEETGLE